MQISHLNASDATDPTDATWLDFLSGTQPVNPDFLTAPSTSISRRNSRARPTSDISSPTTSAMASPISNPRKRPRGRKDSASMEVVASAEDDPPDDVEMELVSPSSGVRKGKTVPPEANPDVEEDIQSDKAN